MRKGRSIAEDSRLTLTLTAGFALAVALFAALVIRWPDNFFADDSYFYFQVAWNIARGFGSTFNNILPTNGYHPLWMLICVAIFKVLPSKVAAVHGIGAVISLLDAGTLVLIAMLLRRIAPGFWWAGWFLFIPFCFLTQLGTEGALSGFFLAVLVLATYELCMAPSGLAGLLFALCGALAVLSRLDNIFVVSLIYLAVLVSPPRSVRPQVRRLLVLCIPVYLLLWGAYVGSNLYWFGTVQPISGMLKAHAHGEAKYYNAPPHIAIFGMTIIVPSIAVLARFRRDTFFRVVELPFAIGVLMHATYIALIMSSETRWSWYYTSWILLASILVSRVFSLVLSGRRRLRYGAAFGSLLILLWVWYVVGYRRFGHTVPEALAAGYQENMSDRLHMHTVLAFDKPGRIAYYTDVRVIALDGLMGDLQFQHDLERRGIAVFDAEHHVDGFIGPTQPLDASQRNTFCGHVYLSSVRLHCYVDTAGEWRADGVEVFARLTGASAGTINLPPRNLVWNFQNEVAVWRLP